MKKFLLWTIGILAIVGGLLYWKVVDVWEIPMTDPLMTTSLAPLLGAGDAVLVRRDSEAELGRIVRCENPTKAGEMVVARLMGVEGNTIDIHQGMVTRNGKHDLGGSCEFARYTVMNPRLRYTQDLQCLKQDANGVLVQTLRNETVVEGDTHVLVGPGRGYLISDNRAMHWDSRDFGQVYVATCRNVVLRVKSGPLGGGLRLVY